MKGGSPTTLYRDRKLAEGYPDLHALSTERFSKTPMSVTGIDETMHLVERIVRLPSDNRTVAVVGCGPLPFGLRTLIDLGYDASGVEPVPGFLDTAKGFLGADAGRVSSGAAEALPYADESVAVVILESVLEHVDSPSKSLSEAHRVLIPGGLAYVSTTNRLRFHPLGENGEFNLPFFNYYPRLLKESYVHFQLHFRPELANLTTRPAVHWFTFADLCARGREAGFHRFYSRLDVLRPTDPSARSALRRRLVSAAQRSPLVRSLLLLQYGGSVFMLKR